MVVIGIFKITTAFPFALHGLMSLCEQTMQKNRLSTTLSYILPVGCRYFSQRIYMQYALRVPPRGCHILLCQLELGWEIRWVVVPPAHQSSNPRFNTGVSYIWRIILQWEATFPSIARRPWWLRQSQDPTRRLSISEMLIGCMWASVLYCVSKKKKTRTWKHPGSTTWISFIRVHSTYSLHRINIPCGTLFSSSTWIFLKALHIDPIDTPSVAKYKMY